MQDTKNLIKKRDIEYPRLIREAYQKNDMQTYRFYVNELESIKQKINNRLKNSKNNKKQFKKANGY